jgi:hypothetical protein
MGRSQQVICVALFVRQRLPVYPDERTSLDGLGMSVWCQIQSFGIELADRRFLPLVAISRHPILGESVPWLIRKTSRCFLLDLPLAPDWSADVPFSFFSEVGSEARWNVILSVPDSHNQSSTRVSWLGFPPAHTVTFKVPAGH